MATMRLRSSQSHGGVEERKLSSKKALAGVVTVLGLRESKNKVLFVGDVVWHGVVASHKVTCRVTSTQLFICMKPDSNLYNMTQAYGTDIIFAMSTRVIPQSETTGGGTNRN
jgi:hypothetical protein